MSLSNVSVTTNESSFSKRTAFRFIESIKDYLNHLPDVDYEQWIMKLIESCANMTTTNKEEFYKQIDKVLSDEIDKCLKSNPKVDYDNLSRRLDSLIKIGTSLEKITTNT